MSISLHSRSLAAACDQHAEHSDSDSTSNSLALSSQLPASLGSSQQMGDSSKLVLHLSKGKEENQPAKPVDTAADADAKRKSKELEEDVKTALGVPEG
jgi:hypothetical protein